MKIIKLAIAAVFTTALLAPDFAHAESPWSIGMGAQTVTASVNLRIIIPNTLTLKAGDLRRTVNKVTSAPPITSGQAHSEDALYVPSGAAYSVTGKADTISLTDHITNRGSFFNHPSFAGDGDSITVTETGKIVTWTYADTPAATSQAGTNKTGILYTVSQP